VLSATSLGAAMQRQGQTKSLPLSPQPPIPPSLSESLLHLYLHVFL
jgi:hypothetical protein